MLPLILTGVALLIDAGLATLIVREVRKSS